MPPVPPLALPALKLDHLLAMTDDTGLLQHAIFQIPRREEGYCVDDNARALLLVTLLEAAGSQEDPLLRSLRCRYLAFVNHAFNPVAGRFRNFMSYGREWLEAAGSEDSHGRTLWALGRVAGGCADPGARAVATHLFQGALPVLRDFLFARAWAYTLLGLHAYLPANGGDAAAQALASQLGEKLLEQYQRHSRPGWLWFEDRVTYCNARLPQALILTGARHANQAMLAAGLEALTWLTAVQTAGDGSFAPVGSNGFFTRGGPRAAFDQQPVDACAMVSACLDAWRISGDPLWLRRAHWAFAWYLGGNQLGLALWDPRGGCRDGLEVDGLNENQGAESTLSFLLSLTELSLAERLRAQASSGTGRTPPPPGNSPPTGDSRSAAPS